MKLQAEPFGAGRRLALAACTVTFAMVAVLAVAARAQATETIYWNNYSASPGSIGFANIDGTGGGALDLTGTELEGPEGMAVDPVSGRLYVAAINNGPEQEGQIVWANLSSGGGGVFSAPGAPVEDPEGLTIDPVTRTIYWINNGNLEDSISWAKLDGSAGGTLNLTGANFDGPYRLAIDPVAGRVYWGSESPVTHELVISYANVNNTGGGDLNTAGSGSSSSANGIAVDPAAGRVYWQDGNPATLYYANINNTGAGSVATGAPVTGNPYGLALDPASGKAYWANYGNTLETKGAIGFANYLTGGGAGGIDIATAPINGPQDPVVLKSPTGAGAPQITQSIASLSCSQGSWSQDYPGSFVYGAPAGYSYQWLSNGQVISGATASTYTATAGGSYSCQVTGKNVSGSASQTSSAVTVTPATLAGTLLTKKPHAKAGKPAMVKLRLSNSGDIASTPVSVCAMLTKKAKKGLVTPKCAPVAALGNGGSAVARLSVKTKKSAKGTYKFTTLVKGATVAPVTVSVKVTAPKKHKKKHHKKK